MEASASKKEKKPWEDIPIEIIIEEERKKREIEDSWKMPRIYDYEIDIPYRKPEEKKKKEQERGVAIIKFYQ